MNATRHTRRAFLGGLASAAAFSIVPRHVVGGPGFRAPSDTLYVAAVGAGGKGEEDLAGVAGERVVALCDVDFERAAASVRRFPEARRYADFRVLLDREPHLDALTISTPDHTHAVVALAAMERGKHVYVQKPLAHNIREVRLLAEAARRHGVATQMGIQGNAFDGHRRVREWIEAGLIGTVREVHGWTDRPIWPQAIARPTERPPVPSHLDWDLWLGPAPERPYHPAYHPFNWRGWWDFGTGALGDMGCHMFDAPFWIFDLRDPVRVEAETTPVSVETGPLASRVTYTFPARGSRPEMRLIWRDGSLRMPRPEAFADDETFPDVTNGQLYVGDRGLIVADMLCAEPRLVPRRLHEEVTATPLPKRYPRSPGIYAEWIAHCKGGPPGGATIPAFSAALTELVLLGNLALRTGEVLEWDAAAGRVTNHDAANGLLARSYRQGWAL